MKKTEIVKLKKAKTLLLQIRRLLKKTEALLADKKLKEALNSERKPRKILKR
jgi:hypothetical protein